MRVIAGRYKGRRLAGLPRGDRTIRPTFDRVRESVFSILGPLVDGAAFLDLYAGTGAVGIEALSRGAARAVFVDTALQSHRIIRANLDMLGVGSEAALVRMDVVDFLKRGDPGRGRYDLVYVDPPYAARVVPKVFEALGRKWLHPGGRVITETDGEPEADEGPGFEKVRTRRYGQSWITIWQSGAEICPEGTP